MQDVLTSSPVLLTYCAFVVAVLGLCMGSFLNCLAWRMTHGESVLHGRSHCTSCGHALGVRDLVPVLSWLASRGTCRYCGDRVSVRYPATEVFCAVVYVSLLLRFGISAEAVEMIAFASVLLVLSLTDLDEYVIPNATIVVAIAIRLAYIALQGAMGADALALLVQSLVGGFAVAVPVLLLALIMDHMLGRESLGGGDVKLLFVAGLYFGWQQCLFLIVVACVLGILMGTFGQASKGEPDVASSSDSDEATSHLIPFGPAIALACWVTMLVGDGVVSWYLSLFL